VDAVLRAYIRNKPDGERRDWDAQLDALEAASDPVIVGILQHMHDPIRVPSHSDRDRDHADR
jgi:hypothetical protein